MPNRVSRRQSPHFGEVECGEIDAQRSAQINLGIRDRCLNV